MGQSRAPAADPNPKPIHNIDLNLSTEGFTVDELNVVIKQMKKGKAPGPDGLRPDLIKILAEENKGYILAVTNHYWKTQTFPTHFEKKANVVSIYKKGTQLSFPITGPSHSCIFYKIHVALIRNRLATAIDPILTPWQFGFRATRSTQQPIFLTRRIQEYSEQDNTNLVIVLLDWKQAFDKIDQPKLIEALKRMNIHQHYINNLGGSF